ncbi:MAG: S9 family peptidase [Candidatus Vogelbacteria bacterium]
MIKPPIASRRPHSMTNHGHTRVDDYYWLRERDNPEVREYLTAENDYTKAMMAETQPLQDKIYNECLGRINETDSTAPVQLDDYWYYSRTEAGKEYSIHCRKKNSLDSPEEILLDPNILAGGKYFQLGVFVVSPDHRYLAYSVDQTGAEIFDLQIKDLTTGALLPEIITGTYYTLAWANDSQTFFYTSLDAVKRPYRIYCHRLGSSVADDYLVYEEIAPGFNVWLRRSRSRKLIFIESEDKNTTESRFISADQPLEPLKLIQPRRAGIEYYPDHHPDGDQLYLLTNDSAPTFRILSASINGLNDLTGWQEVVPASPAVSISNLDVFRDHLVIAERENGLPYFRIINLATNEAHRIAFSEPSYNLEADWNPEFEANTFRFNYSSLATPESVIDYNLVSRAQTIVKREIIRPDYQPADYVVERLMTPATDGTLIPISLIYRRDRRLASPQPLLLYGYGAYEHVIDPSFSSSRISLLDRGFIYAIAHVRGGGELGPTWYEQGKWLNKKNTFTDFIAGAEYLIKKDYTSAEQLVAVGRSAGGLLVGAVANLRPGLFRIIVADVPFVDALTTMLDPTIPLTELEYGEWGNPADQKFYDYLATYSPYDNVTAQNYPNLLVMTNWNDPRVAYWEPAKWVAKLRALKTDNNLLLLKTDFATGHGGAAGRYLSLRELAFEYAFILKTIGIQ